MGMQCTWDAPRDTASLFLLLPHYLLPTMLTVMFEVHRSTVIHGDEIGEPVGVRPQRQLLTRPRQDLANPSRLGTVFPR